MKDTTYMSRVAEALEAVTEGRMIIVVDDYDRENEGDLVAAADAATPDIINFMAAHGRGLICQPITAQRAESLGLPLMAPKADDTHKTAFTLSVDAKACTTGISAFERALTVKTLVDPDAVRQEIVTPGHIFPLIAKEGGVFARKGHTEAAVDIARLAGFSASGVICEIMKDDGTMARLPDLEIFAEKHGMIIISVEELIAYRDALGDMEITECAASVLPTEYGDFRIYSYTSSDPAAGEMVLLERPVENSDDIPYVRLHSECLTGEAFSSTRCDCGPQLERAMKLIGRHGGALLYLKQEGRGIGLSEKIRAYALQDRGADTVEANLALGHPADGRRFGAAGEVLKKHGYTQIRLLTNNPEKIAAVEHAGITITEHISLIEGVGHSNLQYLRTKEMKFGHLLGGLGE